MTAGHWDALRDQCLLGQLLVDRDDRGGETRMSIGKAHQVHHALYRAILARHAMKRVENHICFGFGEPGGDIVVHVDPRDLMPTRFQCFGDPLAARQRHWALGGPASHEDGDMPGATGHL